MFTIDQNITETQLMEKDLFKAFFSLNSHEVATPDMSLEEARSYVFFFREGSSRMSVYIGLHLLISDRRLFYTHSANPFLQDVLRDIEDEARNFAEGLGAFLDEVDFAKMSDVEREKWVEDLSIFLPKKELEPVPTEQTPSPVPPAQPVQAAPAPQPMPEPAAAPAAPVQATPPPMPEPVAVPAASVQAAPAPQPTPQPVTPSPAPSAPASSGVEFEIEPSFEPPAPMTPPPAQSKPASEETEFEVQPSFEPPPPKKPASAPLAAAAKIRQEIMEKAIKAGIAKPPKQPLARELTAPATNMVSRDREALARLLTSF
ncbi:MAG TPA: hypothetical protein VIX18_02330 [Nitrospirota bacterium]